MVRMYLNESRYHEIRLKVSAVRGVLCNADELQIFQKYVPLNFIDLWILFKSSYIGKYVQ